MTLAGSVSRSTARDSSSRIWRWPAIARRGIRLAAVLLLLGLALALLFLLLPLVFLLLLFFALLVLVGLLVAAAEDPAPEAALLLRLFADARLVSVVTRLRRGGRARGSAAGPGRRLCRQA